MKASEGPVHFAPRLPLRIASYEHRPTGVVVLSPGKYYGSFLGSPQRSEGLRFLRLAACESSNWPATENHERFPQTRPALILAANPRFTRLARTASSCLED